MKGDERKRDDRRRDKISACMALVCAPGGPSPILPHNTVITKCSAVITKNNKGKERKLKERKVKKRRVKETK
jgi:hypothetical protein